MTARRWLASLVAKLRAQGIEVAPSRLLDAAHALVEGGDLVTDRDTLGRLLALTLLQTRAARATFDAIFVDFLSAYGPPRPAPKSSKKGHAGALDAQMGGAGASHAGVTVSVASSPDAKPAASQRSSRPSPPLTTSPRRHTASASADVEQIEGESETPEVALREGTHDPLRGEGGGETGLLEKQIEAMLARLEEEGASSAAAAQAMAQSRVGRRDARAQAGRTEDALAEIERALMQSAQGAAHASDASRRRAGRTDAPGDVRVRPRLAPEMLEALRRMARALWLRRSRRSRRFKRGRVDLKTTLAQAARTDGMALRLMRRHRRLRRARLLLLLDVSGSMRDSAPFVLALARGLREAFRAVGAYAFVDHPVAITGGDIAMGLNLMSQSDYGNTFFKMLTEHERMLRKDVVLVVMGDARNNFSDAMTWAVAELRGRVGAMLWLNPEARARWNTGDSVIGQYAPWCDAVLRCATLDDLKQVAQVLVHRAGRWR